jgi:hypothetical protein
LNKNIVSFNVIREDGVEVREDENQSKKMKDNKKSKTKLYKYVQRREVV